MEPTLSTYWHTLRYLKPVQIYRRVWSRFSRPKPELEPSPPRRRTSSEKWVGPARRSASLLGPSRFLFLNVSRELDSHGWDDAALDKLWRYNLHYFDDLNARDSAARASWHRDLLLRWTHQNPPGVGTGWEPYPTSLRIVNWVKWALAGNALQPECLHSLAIQARWLTHRLEFHLLGNHLFSNAKALVFAGLFFDGPEAAEWQRRGLHIIDRQLSEQILPDGGHFERSTLYHALALEDVLDLCNIACAFDDGFEPRARSTFDRCRRQVAAMRRWLVTMTHPDGEIAHFNDAAHGIAPPPFELQQYAERLGFPQALAPGEGATVLRDSGYVRIGHGPAVALLDVGPIGPDYLPAHAHADTLSFELSLCEQRVFVNSGTSCYGDSAERVRQRGTAAHNTVVVDQEDSSEVWSGFRVARRARPIGFGLDTNGMIRVRCRHDGYRRLPGRAEHWREWTFGASAIVVEDRISGRFGKAQARVHVHPTVSLDESASDLSAGRAVLRLPDGTRVVVSVEGGTLRSEPSTWHPEFGCTVPNVCLTVGFAGDAVRTRIDWTGAV